MAEIWEQNEEKDEGDELTVTEHRDDGNLPLGVEETQPLRGEVEGAETIETPTGDPRLALDEQSEDVGSSPARRGHEDPQNAAAREERR